MIDLRSNTHCELTNNDSGFDDISSNVMKSLYLIGKNFVGKK